jgi:hypothetical protein
MQLFAAFFCRAFTQGGRSGLASGLLLAAEVRETGLEVPERATTFFVSLACAVIAGLAAWFGLVVFGIWLFAR